MKNNKNKGFTLIEMMVSVAVLGIIAIVAIPAYQDYVARSQVSEGLSILSGAKIDVEEYVAIHNKFEPNALNNTKVETKLIKGIALSQEGQLSAIFSGDAVSQLSNQTLFLSPSFEDKNIVWNCSGTISSKYLPTSCVSLASSGEGGSNNGGGENGSGNGSNGGGNDNGGGDNPSIPKGPVEGNFSYEHDDDTLPGLDGSYEDGVFYDKDGNPKDPDYIGFSHTDSDGNAVYFSKDKDGNVVNFIMLPDGTLIIKDPNPYSNDRLYENSTTQYSKQNGAGSLETVDSKFLQQDPELGQHYIGKIPNVPEITDENSKGDYGWGNWGKMNQETYDSWDALSKASNELSLLYKYPDNTEIAKTAAKRVQDYQDAMNAYKNELDKIKSVNGGRFPDGMPKIFQDVYTNY